MWGQTSDRDFAKLISRFEVDKVARHALLRATDASITAVVDHYSKEALADQLSNVLREAGARAAGAIVTSVVAGLIEAIWKQNDLLKSQVNRLISQPLISGSQMAHEAINLPGGTAAEKGFKERRLNAAVDELFRAWGLLKDRRADTFDRYVIAKLQGLCFHQLEGGRGSALGRFDEAIGILDRKKEGMRASYIQHFKGFKAAGDTAPDYTGFYWHHHEETEACASDEDFEELIEDQLPDLLELNEKESSNLLYKCVPTWARRGLNYMNGYMELSKMARVLAEIRGN